MTDKFYNGRKEQLSNFEYVGVFMHTFGQEVKYQAEFPSKDICKLRVELIAEELGELKEAIRDKDIVEVADALTDLLYVVYGAGHAFGIDLDKCFNEVHRSNMSKLGLDGKPIYREDGKVLKGQNYFDPDLITIVQGDNNGKETNE
jgi:predicted HAD superfamily Cof-like phosphohydrolase